MSEEKQHEINWLVIVEDATHRDMSALSMLDVWKMGLVAYEEAVKRNVIDRKPYLEIV